MVVACEDQATRQELDATTYVGWREQKNYGERAIAMEGGLNVSQNVSKKCGEEGSQNTGEGDEVAEPAVKTKLQ